MSKRNNYSVIGLLIILFVIWFFTDSNRDKGVFNDRVKVTLRNVGHEILLSSKDSTSLVLPILKLEEQKYEITFKTDLSFEPGTLVSIVQNSFQKANFSNNYLVEVIQCSDNEVAYSFEMLFDKEKPIIPCQGRILPLNCYSITVKFIDKNTLILTQKYLYGLSIIGFILLQLLFYKRKKDAIATENSKVEEALNKNYAVIGVYQFYPDQNKLVREAIEINLSKKECELLSIFIANPNQIIKRDELTKRVWEDHGVFVGRSLDTYISKLRKKMKDDTSIKITNIHGVGYKLEVE